MDFIKKAYDLLYEFKGEKYLYGNKALENTGEIASKEGSTAVLVRGTFPGSDDYVKTIRKSLEQNGVKIVYEEKGARPNAPREDLFRITKVLADNKADIIISFGGGSTIDAVKAAILLNVLGGDIEDYFGVGKVSEALEKSGRSLTPHMAIQTVASSAAHLTKYSNITEISTGQKKLVVDDAIVPQYPVFDFSVTYSTPDGLTMDGAFDGIAHSLEVLYGAEGKPHFEKASKIAEVGISLLLEYLPKALRDKNDREARNAICLGTDLGGYAIMTGGTNGGHLTSFSLVDLLSHGRACAIMNPYYTVFFAPAIGRSLKLIGNIFSKYAEIDSSFENLSGRELGIKVAKAMMNLSSDLGFPNTLGEIEGFNRRYIEKALEAAKSPQLEMKLRNMPVPLSSETVDEYMGAILESATSGNLDIVKNI